MAPRLERFIAISAIAHILFGAISLVSIKKPNIEPLGVYTVTLVTEEAKIPEKASLPTPPSEAEPIPTAKENPKAAKEAIDRSIKKEGESKKEEEIDTTYKEKKIEQLRERLQKQEAIRNLQKRASGVDIKKSPVGKDSGSYAQRLGSAIRQFWYYPLGKKGLEALISITILRDGTIRINRIEKSSGSSVFDESALRAIKKLHSFEPPDTETEIILRFSDEELG